MLKIDIALRATAAGQYLLAKTAHEQAFTAGEYTLANQERLRDYARALFYLGTQYAQGSGITHTQGLQLLVAADVVDSHTNAVPRLAQVELTNYLGSAPRPVPADTPIIRALQGGN